MFKDYDELVREMTREMQRLADQAFAGLVKLSEGPERFWRPRADVYETSEHVLVILEIAGLNLNRYQIELASDHETLTVRGTRLELPSDRSGRVSCHQLEIYYGPFERSVPLPGGAPFNGDKIEASYTDGFLRILLPRRKGSPIPLVATD